MAKTPAGMPFSPEETDTLLFGLCLVAQWEEDGETALFTQRLGRRIAAMLPAGMAAGELRRTLEHVAPTAPHGSVIKMALRHERKIEIAYADKNGAASQRVVWPLGITGFDAPALTAWCEMRADFRHFRLDRINAASCLEERLPRPRRLLLAEWRASVQGDW